MVLYYAFSQDVDANEDDNSKEFSIAVKYEADLVIKGYVQLVEIYRHFCFIVLSVW